MEAKLIKTQHAEYVHAPWNGKNESGIRPLGDRVLLLPDTAAEQSSGKVFLDPRFVERGSFAAETGIVVALGDTAFTGHKGQIPAPGERVYFEKYAGQPALGKDRRMYRLADYQVIGGFAE